MRSGIREALRPLRPYSQHQVVLVTDGHRLGVVEGLATVEIQCDTLLWNPEVSFEAELGDGTVVTLRVDTAASTRRTRVTRGAWVRLRFQPLLREGGRLWWHFDGVAYIVTF